MPMQKHCSGLTRIVAERIAAAQSIQCKKCERRIIVKALLHVVGQRGSSAAAAVGLAIGIIV
jgi:hypothetical protein